MDAKPMSLSELSNAWSQQLGEIGEDKIAVESSMSAAQAIVRQHAERLNDFNHVVSLPVEILQPIFFAIRDAQADDNTAPNRTDPANVPWPPPPPPPPPPHLFGAFSPPYAHPPPRSQPANSRWIAVSHVCRRWRHVAIASSDLWANIDVSAYGIPFCKEMLSRIGARPFSLSAVIKAHQDILFDIAVRERIPRQLWGLTLDFDHSVTQPGIFLDTLLSCASDGQDPILRQLWMTSSTMREVTWSTLAPAISNLVSLHLFNIRPCGRLPISMPKLTDLVLNSMPLTLDDPPDSLCILDLIAALPVLQSITLIDCSFHPTNERKATLPPSMKLVQFESTHNWSLHHFHALSRLLPQSTGDRIFKLGGSSNFDAVEHIFADITDTLTLGLNAHDVVVELAGWNVLNATIEFKRTHHSEERAFYIQFSQLSPSLWPAFCASLSSIDTRDATLRFKCEEGTPGMFTQDNTDISSRLRRLAVTSIDVTGRYAVYLAIDLFRALREPDEEDSSVIMNEARAPLSFPALRDICIEQPFGTTTGIGSYSEMAFYPGMMPVESLQSTLDEAALCLLWYSRIRRYRDFRPLRTVALPSTLLGRHWVMELDGLLEDAVVPVERFRAAQKEVETPECRAVVLYHPVLRALRFWETWALTVVPVIGTLGILWTSSRRK